MRMEEGGGVADVHGDGLVVGVRALRDGAGAGDLRVDGSGDVLLKDDGEIAVETRLARKVLSRYLLICTRTSASEGNNSER